MAKQYYTSEEAQAKLGMAEEQLKELVRDGQLREFRDAGQIRYKADEVDGVAENLATLSGSLSGTSGELILEPADETSAGLTGSDMLTLDEVEGTEGDATVVDDQKDDTVITSVGISVFDDEEVQEADPAAKTVMSKEESRAGESSLSVESLGSSGTGSGLLDLTKESDDTSLGAELLDEIYTEDQEAGLPEMGDATRAGLDAGLPEESEPQELFDKSAEQEGIAPEAPTSAPAFAPQIVVQDSVGPVEMGLGVALIGSLIVLSLAGVTVSANMQGIAASLLDPVINNLPIYCGVAAGVTLICFAVGFFVGRRG